MWEGAGARRARSSGGRGGQRVLAGTPRALIFPLPPPLPPPTMQPGSDWKYKLWDEESVVALVKDKYPHLWDTWAVCVCVCV